MANQGFMDFQVYAMLFLNNDWQLVLNLWKAGNFFLQ